jgi:TolB-like protein
MATKPQDLREPSSSPPSGDRLNSWKEIAAYLNCSESTVRRWEEEGLPVHRHLHKTKAAIYAYKTEIDAWWRDGHARLKEVEEPREGAFTARSRFWKTPWLWAGLAVSFGIALVAGNLGGLRDRQLRKSPPPRIQSLAVLPLQNLSHDPEQEYFADGMTDALITDLAQIGPLRVISRTSSMQYKQTNKSLPEIARELNVDGVVEGTVQRSGDRVRITAQLIYGPSDKHLWARSYERDSRDVLALQQEVASAIADEIEIKVTPQKPIHLASAHPVNVQAHDSYLRGLQQLRSETPEDIERAIEYFQQAVTHDSNYALAYSGLADAYHEQSTLFRAPLEVLPKAKAAAVRAIELDDSLAEAHASLGYVKLEFDWDWSGANASIAARSN